MHSDPNNSQFKGIKRLTIKLPNTCGLMTNNRIAETYRVIVGETALRLSQTPTMAESK
jgi:hypothetical protein